MLKTNSKQAKENIRAYILANYCEEYNEGEDVNPESISEVKQAICEAFYEEKAKHDNRRLSHQALFIEWAQGLPSVLDTCYYYNRSAVKDLGDILEETEEERNRYSETQAEDLLTRLIYRELFC